MPRARAVMVDMEPKVRTFLHRKLNVASLCVFLGNFLPCSFFEFGIFQKVRLFSFDITCISDGNITIAVHVCCMCTYV